MTNDTQSWKDGALYKMLVDIFPEHRTINRLLDIPRIATDLGMSHEAVYKWFRARDGRGKLLPANAEALRLLASSEPNRSALIAAGRALPTREDFETFIYA